MDRVRIQTSQNVALNLEVAGLGDRILAALLDYAVIGAYLTGSLLVTQALLGGLSTASVVPVILPALLYFLLCEVFMDGQSIGKRYMNIKVTRRDGSAATLGNFVVRWLLRLVDVSLTNGLAAVVTILATGTGQRLGDLAAGTAVVKVRPRTRLEDTLYVDLEDDYRPTYPEVRALSPRDAATAKQVLTALEDDPEAAADIAERTRQALARKMDVSPDAPPANFLRTVLRDYNHVQ
jgi:uncharacterized RDD family membrane protein YckC